MTNVMTGRDRNALFSLVTGSELGFELLAEEAGTDEGTGTEEGTGGGTGEEEEEEGTGGGTGEEEDTGRGLTETRYI